MSIASFPFRWWCALSLVALAAPVEEPINPVLITLGDSYRFAAKPLGSAPLHRFMRAVTGRFNEDAQPDVFVRRRFSAHLFVNPTIWDAALSPPAVGILGVARLSGTASTGRDELLVTSSLGLRAWTRHSASNTWTSRAIGNDALWSNVNLLVTADLDGLHGDDIVGVAPSGTQAMILLAAGNGTFLTETVFPLPAVPLSIVPCDIGGLGSRLIVCLNQSNVRVYHFDGSPRFNLPVGGSAVSTVLQDAGSPAERVAWVVDGAQGDVLRILDEDLVAEEYALGDIDACGLAAWDFDVDGDDDVAVSHRAGWDLRLLTNNAGAFSGVQKKLDTGPPGAATTNQAWPAVCDLDGDGDEDVLIPVQVDEKVYVCLNGAIDHHAITPQFVEPVVFNWGTYGQTAVHGYLQVEGLDASVVPAEATHVELAVWRRVNTMTPTSDLPAPGFNFRFALGPPYETGVLQYLDPEPGVLFWILRYVQVAGGETIRVFPASVHAVTTNHIGQNGGALTYLLSRGGTILGETVPDPAISAQTGFEAARSTSTIVKLTPITDYDPNREPGTGN